MNERNPPTTRPIVTTIAELEAAIMRVFDEERTAWTAALNVACEAAGLTQAPAPRLSVGDINVATAAMTDFISRSVNRRFDVRLPPKAAAAKYCAMAAAATEVLGRLRFATDNNLMIIMPRDEDQ